MKIAITKAVKCLKRISAMMPFPTGLEPNFVWFPEEFLTLEEPLIFPRLLVREDYTAILRELNERLSNLRRASNDWDAIYLGVVPLSSDGTAGLASNRPSEVGASASWFNFGPLPEFRTPESALVEARNAGSHEFGHTIGLTHPARREDTNSGSGALYGVCGENVESVEEQYPYLEDPYPPNNGDPHAPYEIADGDSNNEEFLDDEKVALLGPLGDINKEVWGLDIARLQERTNPDFTRSNLLDTLIVSDPREVYSVMSGCFGRAYNNSLGIIDSTQSQWLDAYNHDYIVNNADDILEELSGVGRHSPSTLERLRNFAADLFTGKVIFASSSSSTATSVEMARIYSRPREPREIVPGNYVLELRDNDGTVLRSIPFSASRPEALVLDGSDVEFDSADFGFLVHNPPDYTSFAIKQGDRELITVQRSSNARLSVLLVSQPIRNL